MREERGKRREEKKKKKKKRKKSEKKFVAATSAGISNPCTNHSHCSADGGNHNVNVYKKQ